MNHGRKRPLSFPLRLPMSVRDAANELARKEGVSLNHFISLAVAEKITRLEQSALNPRGLHMNRANPPHDRPPANGL